jgi:hypothetical protein
MERRVAFGELFKLGDTPEATMQKVLDLQASHHAEDQTTETVRYKQNLKAQRLWFIHLVSCPSMCQSSWHNMRRGLREGSPEVLMLTVVFHRLSDAAFKYRKISLLLLPTNTLLA